MSLKAELETWAAALKAYDENDYEKSLDLFSVRRYSHRPFGYTASLLLTIGFDLIAYRGLVQDLDEYGSYLCHSGRTRAGCRAVYQCDWVGPVPRCRVCCIPLVYRSRNLYLHPCRYFQCGVSNFLLARYELSHKDFEEALLYLRGNESMYVLRHLR
jgi:hypothetical protein